jgi:hypothetical protein
VVVAEIEREILRERVGRNFFVFEQRTPKPAHFLSRVF